jgi:hypothetical protein
MWNGVCPLCQSRQIYARPHGLQTYVGEGLVRDLRVMQKDWLRYQGIELLTYICVRCGYVTLNITDDGLEGLEEKLVRWGWTAIEEVHPDGTVGSRAE